jgi:prolipoprotein diacylglyceryltransferase
VIAFYLPGGYPVHLFSLLVGAGSALGLAWAAYQAPEKAVLNILDAGLSILAGAAVGGRAVYVAAHWEYFQGAVPEAFQISRGGSAWLGALLGGVIGLVIYSALTKQSLGSLADQLLPLGLTLATAIWLACWLDGVAYGHESASWWALPAGDEWGVVKSRLPLAQIGALVCLAIFWLVERLRSYFRVPGQAALLALLLLSLQMLLISLLRADPAPTWGAVRLETAAAAFIAVATLLTFSAVIFRSRKKVELAKQPLASGGS